MRYFENVKTLTSLTAKIQLRTIYIYMKLMSTQSWQKQVGIDPASLLIIHNLAFVGCFIASN